MTPGDLRDVVDLLRQLVAIGHEIQQMLDIGAFIARGAEANVRSFLAFAYLIFRTEDPLHHGQPFTGMGPVRDFTHLTQAASDAALAVVLTWTFYRLMWAERRHSPYALQYILPRAAVAAVLINLPLPLIQSAVDVSNVLSTTIVNDALRADLEGLIRQPLNPQPDALQQLTDFGLFAGTLLLGIVYVIRLTVLVVLTIVAPIAALLWIIPEAHTYAADWANLFTTTLLMQPVQLLLLQIGFALDRYGGLPIRHLFVLAILFVTFHVPGALGSSSRVGGRSFTFLRSHTTRAWRQVVRAIEKGA